MKFKYKKAILLSLLSTLGMGMLTLSVAPGHATKEISSNHVVADQNKDSTPDKNDMKDDYTDITPSVTIAPSTLPVYPFEKEAYDEITTLIKKYYAAKLSCDAKTIKTLLTNPSKVATKDELKKNIMFIESYKDIKCHVKKSFRKNEYVIFVSHNIKFYNIKTLAPALDEFYIMKDDFGTVKIYSDDFDEQTAKYYRDRTKDDEVVKMIKEIKKKVETARKNDKKFKAFWDSLIKTKTTKKS